MRSTDNGTPRRLYRGLKEPYDPEKVGGRQTGGGGRPGTDFTDCPYAALQYAKGRRGVLLVVEVPADERRVREELWGFRDGGPKRLMLWGAFDEFIVAEIPAKELRKHVRRKGVVAGGDDLKARVLEQAVEDWIAAEGL